MATVFGQLTNQIKSSKRMKLYEGDEALDALKFNVAQQKNEEISAGRTLTQADQKWESKKEDVDAQMMSLNELIDEKGLTKKDINYLREVYPKVIKSAHALYNQEGDYRLENYINSNAAKFQGKLNAADYLVDRNDQIKALSAQIYDLGDNERDYGKFSLPNSDAIVQNIANMIDTSRRMLGDEKETPFKDIQEELDRRVWVSSEMDFYINHAPPGTVTGPNANPALAQAYRAITGGNENFEEAERLLKAVNDDIASDLKFQQSEGLRIGKEKGEKFDAIFNANTAEFQAAYEDDDSLSGSMQKHKTFKMPTYRKGDLGIEEIRVSALQTHHDALLSLMGAVSTFNIDTWADEGFASDLNLQDLGKEGDIYQIIEYFGDTQPIEGMEKKGINTEGEARIDKIKAGNPRQTRNAKRMFRALIQNILLAEEYGVKKPPHVPDQKQQFQDFLDEMEKKEN